MTLLQGQVLENRYRVVGLLGQGGMGAVYRAWDMNLRVPVALKENLDLSGDSRSQFEHEALMLAQLSHPNLPRVTNHFFVPGQGQYLVMEFIDGQDLQEKLEERGRLTEAEVLPIIGQITSALSYLHSRPEPIIHRDIKPANIKIGSDGRAMLVDFGIAKRYIPQSKTTRGAQAVTPGFSPPEQYGLGSTDARSDIYATGATLYALLTGQTPTESVTRLAGATLPQPAGVSPPVARTILRAMEMDPVNRFQRAADMTEALAGRAVPGPTPAAPARSPWPIVAIVALILLLAGGGFLAWQFLGRPEPEPTPVVEEPSGEGAAAIEATQTAIAVAQTELIATQSAAATEIALTAAVEGDNDGDGLSNDQEAVLDTDPGNPDSDADGLSDGDEVLIYKTSATNRDSDGDVLSDSDEVNSYRTNPIVADSDGDGTADGAEVTQGRDPLAPDEPESAESETQSEPPPATATPTVTPSEPSFELTSESIGSSAGGQPITVYKLGDGPRVVTIVGGIHAGFAPAGVAVVDRAAAHFSANPDELPDGVALHFIPNANPDSPLDPGNLPGRLNANGVDLNRNFGCEWSDDTTTSRGQALNEGSGPFSEPEAVALRDYFLDARPAVVIFYDARASDSLVLPGECPDGNFGDTPRFARAYDGAGDFVYDDTTALINGDVSNWLVDQDIPAFFILLTEYDLLAESEWSDNLDGIRQVIALAGQ